jgi:hypothetical protein
MPRSKRPFAVLTKRRLKRGTFVGIVDLQAAINRYVADHNTDPKPFRWKANPDKIIAAAARGHQTLDLILTRVFAKRLARPDFDRRQRHL